MATVEEWQACSQELQFDVRSVINGQRMESKSNDATNCVNPANGSTLYALPVGSAEDADAAVTAGRAAFDRGDWANLSPLAHKAILMGFADKIEAHQEELALLDSLEMGKPVLQAVGDCIGCAHIFRYYAEFTDKVYANSASTAPRLVQYQRREPRGVIGAVVPWNYPLPNAALKVAPAIAAGNSVVLKPSEQSSSSALRLAELAVESGIPPNVFNVVPGLGATVGAALAAHGGVDMIAFTGSTATGRKLLAQTGNAQIKPLQLECGGKSANIVFADCVDLSAVAQDAAGRIFANQGQLCVAGTRLVVHRSIKDALVSQIVACAEDLQIGDPLDPNTTFGPLVSASRKDAVLTHCREATGAGATARIGGKEALPSSGGAYVEPTIFEDVSPDMAVAQEDIFGPVLSVLTFETLDEAVELANATVYGLSATVWTQNMTTAHEMIRRLKAGRVTVLSQPIDSSAFAFPMGAEPVGQSGFGAESGREGFEAYTRLKAVELNV